MFSYRPPKGSFLIILGFPLLFVCAALAMLLSWQQRSAESWVRHTLEVENRLGGIQVLVTRAEINRRGYLLTGSAENKAKFAGARAALSVPLAELEKAVADSPVQQHRARRLHAIIADKLAEMQMSMTLYDSGQRERAAAVIGTPVSRMGARHLVKLVETMRADEDRLLASRSIRSSHLERYTLSALIIGAILILALALLLHLERGRRLITLAENNDALERENLARRALERDLDAARVSAEAAARSKTNFLANMSHEIRTPMNGEIGFTDLLLASDLSPQQRRQTELIADSGRAMMGLLNDILDLSKVEAGQMTVSVEPFDLPHALKACIKLMVPAIEQRGLRFHYTFADDLPTIVFGDGLRLRQIILNLLGNASKFTMAGEISLSVKRADRAGRAMIEIDVQDTGIGIAAECQATVFDYFVQAGADITARFGGSGLGLAISSQLAGLMGGDLSLKSELGKGSCFRLSLPLSLPDAPDFGMTEALAVPAETCSPTRDKSAIRVLVAEDHDVNQMLMVEMLGHLGVRADLAEDGEEAVEMVAAAADAKDPYSLVLMDMQMPRVDGCEATVRIRATGLSPAVLPIIALTANAYADDIAVCLNAGMQAHLTKPIKIGELDTAICRWAAQPIVQTPPATGANRFSPRLRERYAARRQELIDRLGVLSQGDRISDDEVVRLSQILHKFAGSAGMFGDDVLGQHARSLEQGLATCGRADRLHYARKAAEAMQAVA